VVRSGLWRAGGQRYSRKDSHGGFLHFFL